MICGIDTNILIYAHDNSSPFQAQALHCLENMFEQSVVAVAELSLREFYAVVTDGRKLNNSFSIDESKDIISDIYASPKFLVCSTNQETWLNGYELVGKYNISRYRLDDLLIALTLADGGAEIIYTANIKDFKKFDFIKAINPFHEIRIPQSKIRNGLIPYGRQSISEKDVAAVCKVLRSDWLTQGPGVPSFEKAVADYCGANHATAVNSGTSALHLACLALGVGPGDLVWTSPITFVASANCARYCGADVDFVDIDPRTHNLSQDCLADKLNYAKAHGRLPKVVIPVHLAGQPCDMTSISDLSKKYGFYIIEDACHAIGGRYKGETIGNCHYSDITIFSFHPVKTITTAEGGMALTNDPALAERMSLLRTHGITRERSKVKGESSSPPAWYYEQIALGFNYRMTDVQAALGLSQLARLDEFVNRRHALAQDYDKLLAGLPVTTPWQHPDVYSGLHLYVIRLKLDSINISHRQVFDALRAAGIGVNLHYIPVYWHPDYQKLGFPSNYCPQAERYYAEAISFPMFPGLTKEEQEWIVATLSEIISS